MSRVFVVNRKKLFMLILVIIVATVAISYLIKGNDSEQSANPVNALESGTRTIHMVTGEFKSTLPDGSTIEAYQWHPGTIPVKKGEHVDLKIFGVNGEKHSFLIEGFNVKGEVKKGKETVVSFKADKEGIFRIICTDHPSQEHFGPMIGYIVVYDF